jgi:hypothetical protein
MQSKIAVRNFLTSHKDIILGKLMPLYARNTWAVDYLKIIRNV